ncbi:MAG: hypothetical protein ABJL72_16565 [Roseobacter sp.]
MKRVLLGMAAATAAAIPVYADESECPDFSVSERNQDSFCEEFLELLYGRYIPDRQRANGDDLAPEISDIISSDKIWGEVYRADPNSTLKLIQRIRDAGGLEN